MQILHITLSLDQYVEIYVQKTVFLKFDPVVFKQFSTFKFLKPWPTDRSKPSIGCSPFGHPDTRHLSDRL